MLLTDVIVSLRPKVTVKVAFILGSSKHGKARRASVDSNCVTANHLTIEYIRIQFKKNKINTNHDLLSDAIFHVRGSVEPS